MTIQRDALENISEEQTTAEMSLQALHRKLLTHELEVQQRKSQMNESKNKSLALVSIDKVKLVVTRPRLVEEEEEENSKKEEVKANMCLMASSIAAWSSSSDAGSSTSIDRRSSTFEVG